MPPRRPPSGSPSGRNKKAKINNDVELTSRVTRSQASGSASAGVPGQNEEAQPQIPDQAHSEVEEDSQEPAVDPESDAVDYSEYFDTEVADEPNEEKGIKAGAWKIKPKDNDEPIEWKNEQRDRLTITFQRKEGNETRAHHFPLAKGEKFDFDDRNHVRRLNRFRTKLCYRYLEYEKQKGGREWLQEEEDFMEVWLRKSALANESYEVFVGKDGPITNALNEYFQHRGDLHYNNGKVANLNHSRLKGEIENKKRHKDKEKKGDKKSKKEEVWVDIDFRTYTSLEKAHELCHFLRWSAKPEKFFVPYIDDRTLKHFREHREVSLSKSEIDQLSRKFEHRGDNSTDRTKTHVDEQEPPPMERKGKEKRLKTAAATTTNAAASQTGGKPLPDVNTSGETSQPSNQEPPFKPTTSPENPKDPAPDPQVRNEHQDSRNGWFSALRTTLQHPESEYRFADMPQNDDEAWLRHLDQNDKAGHDWGYIDALKADFTTRFDKHGYPPLWDYDRDKKKKMQKQTSLNTLPKWQGRVEWWQGDDNYGPHHHADWSRSNPFKLDYRQPEAAGASALINTAVLPPIGYMGHTCRLIDRGLLPKEELGLHEASRNSRKLMVAIHDRCFYNEGEQKIDKVDDHHENDGDDDETKKKNKKNPANTKTPAPHRCDSPPPTVESFNHGGIFNWRSQAEGLFNRLENVQREAQDDTVEQEIDGLRDIYNGIWNELVKVTDLQTGEFYDKKLTINLGTVSKALNKMETARKNVSNQHAIRNTRTAENNYAIEVLKLQTLLCRQNADHEDPTKRYQLHQSTRDGRGPAERRQWGPHPSAPKDMVGTLNYRRPSHALQNFVDGRKLYKMKWVLHEARRFRNIRTKEGGHLILHTNGKQIGYRKKKKVMIRTKEFFLHEGDRQIDNEKFLYWVQDDWDKKFEAFEKLRALERPLRGDPSPESRIGHGGSERMFSEFVACYMEHSGERQATPRRRVSDNVTLYFRKAHEVADEKDIKLAKITDDTDVVVVEIKPPGQNSDNNGTHKGSGPSEEPRPILDGVLLPTDSQKGKVEDEIQGASKKHKSSKDAT